MESKWEEAVKHGKKEGMIWAGYAWCLVQNKEKDKAIKVLARAVETNPSDEKLKSALTALQNDKRLKMKAWEPGWWQLGLESPQQPQPMFVGGGRRRFR
jgi:Tfp pilus assembly protein PilF